MANAKNSKMGLKNKSILITAGPTWAPIDNVRVISNIATGETGILLSQKLRDLGARVTLLLGPVGACCLSRKIKLIRFRFFDELKRAVKKELGSKKYDMVIHCAAVSDYKAAKVYPHKVRSDKKGWTINLIPTEKIIGLIKKIDASLFLVGFKFEPGVKKEILIRRAKRLINRGRLDLAVANTVNKKGYLAYIVNRRQSYGPIFNKKKMVGKLIRFIRDNPWKN